MSIGMNTPAQRVKRITDEAVGRDLTSWERHEFLPSIAQRRTLTDKQEQILAGIEQKVFGDAEE